MQKTSSPGSTSHTVVAVLTLSCPDGRQCVRSLYDGHDILVGSEPSADLRVSGDGIAAMHCLVRAHQGAVSVRDCYSPSGTFLDERRVTEAEIPHDSVIRVGPFSVAVAICSQPPVSETSSRTSSVPAGQTRPGTTDARAPQKSTPLNSSDLLRALLSPQLAAPRTAPGSSASPNPAAASATPPTNAPVGAAAAVPAMPAVRTPAAGPATPVRVAIIAPQSSVRQSPGDQGLPPEAGSTPGSVAAMTSVPTDPAPAVLTAARTDAGRSHAAGTPAGATSEIRPTAARPADHAAVSQPLTFPSAQPDRSDKQRSAYGASAPAAAAESEHRATCGSSSAAAPEDSALRTIISLRSQLEQANAEISALKDCLDAGRHQAAASEEDPWQAEMIELLRAEVVELQTTVAEFHSASAGRSRSHAADDDVSDLISRDEAERLVERLDGLLGELQQRDEQVRLLNDLLEAAENANQAEQDERRQLNRWVSDIERRIGLREEEWQAERQKLTESIGRLKAERDRIEAAVSAENVRTRNEAVQRMMDGLREEAESLRGSLTESEARCSQLRRDLDEASRKDFREEAVKLAQERAELARMRHELETARQIPEKHTELSESSLRFRALRQHLNEVHDKEKTVRPDTKLGSRISRLWNLLEGK